jgi:hypothetical protein
MARSKFGTPKCKIVPSPKHLDPIPAADETERMVYEDLYLAWPLLDKEPGTAAKAKAKAEGSIST